MVKKEKKEDREKKLALEIKVKDKVISVLLNILAEKKIELPKYLLDAMEVLYLKDKEEKENAAERNEAI